MTCYHPVRAYISTREKTEKGKKKLVFNKKLLGSKPWEEIDIKCGRCIGCRIDRSREWALRCVHEASLYTHNCFLTLTFDDEHINSEGTLVTADYQKFMKRLRNKAQGLEEVIDAKGGRKRPIRYYHVGEYGAKMERPHHHACIFNFDFLDKELWNVRKGVKLFRSKFLEELWPYGFCTVGDVTFKSAAYCARYIMKKQIGGKDDRYRRVNKETGEVTMLKEEYTTMSLKPGIGKGWYEKYKGDCYPKDFVTHEGKKFRNPKYYERIFELENKKVLESIKKDRIKRVKEKKDDNTLERLKTREKVHNAKLKRLVRSAENET